MKGYFRPLAIIQIRDEKFVMKQKGKCQYPYRYQKEKTQCNRSTLPDTDYCAIHVKTREKCMPFVTFSEGENLREAYFVDGKFKGTGFAMTDLSFSDLEGSSLWNADLSGAYLERVNFRKVDLFNAKISDSHLLWSAVLDNIEINEVRGDICWKCTTEGKAMVRCWKGTPIDPDYQDAEEYSCRGGPVEAIDAYLRAHVVNRQLKAHFRDTGWFDKSRSCYIRERILDGKKWRTAHRITGEDDFKWHFPEYELGKRGSFLFGLRTRLKWLMNTLLRWTSNYGESPHRILATAIVLIVICGLLYFVFDLIQPGAITRISIIDSTTDSLLLAEYLYFSLLTFVTISFGDYSLAVWTVKALASVEALVGIFTFAYFVGVVSRRIIRD